MYLIKQPDETYERFYKRVLDTFTNTPRLHHNTEYIDFICNNIPNLPQKFMIEFAEVLDWRVLCYNQHLSNELMDVLSDFMNWSIICWSQKLTEWFMEKYADKINWHLISERQKLSEEFLIRYFDKIDLNRLITNKKTKAKESFWRTALTLNPQHQFYCVGNFSIKFSINFIREFKNQFKNLQDRYIIIEEDKKEKIHKEFDII